MYFFQKNLHHYAKLSVHLHSKCQTADEAIWAEPRYAMANNVFIYIRCMKLYGQSRDTPWQKRKSEQIQTNSNKYSNRHAWN